ncbi:hypothetical protein ACFE04_029959 [Oxalis oulophora]
MSSGGEKASSSGTSSNSRSGNNNNDNDNDNDNDNRGVTSVGDCGRNKSSCGYCKSPGRTSLSHGLIANSLTVDDYQDLLDRGWRRSGCFLYKPIMEKTCCPSYTIRLKASDFSPSKEQLRVSRRIQRFLEGTLDVKKPSDLVDDEDSQGRCSRASQEVAASAEESSTVSEENKNEEQIIHYLSKQIDNAVLACVESNTFPSGIELPKASVKKVTGAKRKLQVKESEDLKYSSNIAFQISATLRRSTHSGEENKLPPKIVAESLASYLIHLQETYGLSTRACNGHINFYSAAKKQDLTDKDVKVTTVSKKSNENSQVKRRKLEIHLKKSSFDPEEYELYRRYQIKVHNDAPDRVTESSYRRFLVETPLIHVDGVLPFCGFGSFHQQYVIDGKLVAVGVIDILPKCLSSKYLFWDPDYAFLSLGKYSALQEISWVKENQAYCNSLQYYYLGYYIHSCSKMRYKAAYRPSELLCPLRYQWVPFDTARPVLDRKKSVGLSYIASLQSGETSLPNNSEGVLELEHDDNEQEERNDAYMDRDEEMAETESESSDDDLNPVIDDMTPDGVDINNVLIGLQGSQLSYKELQRAVALEKRKYLESHLYRYQKAVGVELSKRIVYTLG